MGRSLYELVSAHDLWLNRLAVSGYFFLEVFAGEAIAALGCVMHKVPSIRPWDILYGDEFDVLKHENVLSGLIVVA